MHPLLTLGLVIFNIYVTKSVFFPSFKENLAKIRKGSPLRIWLWKGVFICLWLWIIVLISLLDYVGFIDIKW